MKEICLKQKAARMREMRMLLRLSEKRKVQAEFVWVGAQTLESTLWILVLLFIN